MYGTSRVMILVMKLKSKVVMGPPPPTTTLIGAKETIRTRLVGSTTSTSKAVTEKIQTPKIISIP
jgi:hypothetical protein